MRTKREQVVRGGDNGDEPARDGPGLFCRGPCAALEPRESADSVEGQEPADPGERGDDPEDEGDGVGGHGGLSREARLTMLAGR